MVKTPSKFNRRRTIAILLLLTMVSIGGLLFWRQSSSNQNIIKTDSDGGIINLNPPTEQEEQAGDIRKQEIDQEEATPSRNDDVAKKTVSVIITDAGQYAEYIEVRAFIPNYYQDGTCTITFRKNSQSLIKTAPAYTDSANTICTNPEIKRSEFPSDGSWQVSVTYESKNAKGTSDQQTITIR